MPWFSATFSHRPPQFDAVHGNYGPSVPHHHRRPVEWFLEACQRRGDPDFTFTGQADRWSLCFTVDARYEDQAVSRANVLARQVWPNRTPQRSTFAHSYRDSRSSGPSMPQYETLSRQILERGFATT